MKRKSFQVQLTPIDPGRPVRVATFATDKFPPVDPTSKRLVKDTWVSLVPDVQEICRKRSGDAILAIEQILGLPPRGDSVQYGKWMMYQFAVEASYVFRPCVSSSSIVTTTCKFTPPKTLGPDAAFVFDQIWAAGMVGIQGPGYPFTGMGWTYDWSPRARPKHIGVSEYVVRKGAPVSQLERAVTAKVLCSSTVSQ